MKVTLDLTELLAQEKITREEHDRLVALSRKDTKVHAFSIFTVLALIAVVTGTVGLFPDLFRNLGQALFELFGARGLHLLVIILSGAGAMMAASGFLAAICAFGILTFIGDAGMFYTHAEYFIAIKEPALTVLFFSGLAYGSYIGARNLKPKQQRAAIVFSRTCIFIVNLAFWIGSLWGSKLGETKIPDFIFALGWAMALLST
jgi:hypothetical protein